MAIKASVNSAKGININSGTGSYLETLPEMFSTTTGNFGYFYDNLNSAKAYGLALEVEGSIWSGGPALLAKGLLRYDMTRHIVTGRLDSIAFGKELNGLSGGFGITSTKMSLGTTDVTFAGLGLDQADGDDVNGILYGLMTGDAAKFLKFLATNAVSFTGGKGDDTYVAGNRIDTLSGGGGADKLYGGGGNDVMAGGLGKDTLAGGGGDDRITGNGGADTLTGGAGKDVFIFKAQGDSVPGRFDTIGDFTGADLIDLSAIDANSKTGRNQAFDFIGTADFSGKAGELRYSRADGTDIFGDTDGDGKADFLLHLDDSLKLSSSDFNL